MKPRVLFPLVLALVVWGCNDRHVRPAIEAPSPSSSSAPIAITSSADVVKVHVADVSIPEDGSAEAIVTLSILPGYHINANPATFSYLIPTEVTAGTVEGLNAGKPVYPTAEKRQFQFAEQPLAVYEGEAQIKFKLQTLPPAGRRPRSMPITIRVQACDNEKCYAPASLNATVALDIK